MTGHGAGADGEFPRAEAGAQGVEPTFQPLFRRGVGIEAADQFGVLADQRKRHLGEAPDGGVAVVGHPRAAAQAISDLRDAAGGGEQDQGLTDGSGNANLVPTDANGIAYSRTTRQVLNIVYLAKDAKTGGFFPNGLNGAVA